MAKLMMVPRGDALRDAWYATRWSFNKFAKETERRNAEDPTFRKVSKPTIAFLVSGKDGKPYAASREIVASVAAVFDADVDTMFELQYPGVQVKPVSTPSAEAGAAA